MNKRDELIIGGQSTEKIVIYFLPSKNAASIIVIATKICPDTSFTHSVTQQIFIEFFPKV